MGVSETNGLLVGVDVGTSSVKAVLVTVEGRLVGEVAIDYPMSHPHAGWAETNPDDWVNTVVAAVRRLVAETDPRPSAIAGIAIVCVREPGVLLGADGDPLCPAVSWTDRRSQREVAGFRERFGSERFLETAGLPLITGSTLASLMWTINQRPDVWAATERVLLAKDYIMYRLAGGMATDSSTPGRTGLLDIRTGDWSADICGVAGIDVGRLPEIAHHPAQLHGRLSRSSAEQLGLPPGIALAVGGGDDPAAALGGGAIRPGDLCAGTGTASSWRVVSGDPEPDRSGRTELAPHVIPGMYIREAVISSTGSSMRWFKDYVDSDLSDPETHESAHDYPWLIAQAAAIPPGAGGLFFYPYLEGSAMPRFNPEATGVFFGVTASTTRAHMARAIIEGIAFQYPPSVDALRSYGLNISELTVVDGEARSAVWNQLKADVLGFDVLVPEVTRAAGLGATMLAGVAAGVFSDLDEATGAMFRTQERYVPDPATHQKYAEIRSDYEKVYAHLDEAYREVGLKTYTNGE